MEITKEKYIEISLGFYYVNINFNRLFSFIEEIEVGLDTEDFKLEYFHKFYDWQIHQFNFGFLYFFWKGAPLIDL